MSGPAHDTDERVRAAAVRLFAEKGFNGTGIRELADAAGLSSASLYHYMGTKQDLLTEIMETSLNRLVAAARMLAGRGDGPAATIAALVQMHVAAHALRQDETIVVDNELRALTPERRVAVLALRDAYEQVWREVIDDGCARGAFRVPDARVARLALLEMCTGVARWYSPGGPLSLAEVTAAHAAMALAMLGCADPPAADGSAIELLAELWR
ncbi:TetR/AcrR family transcriptional regulator [Microbispora sp. ATCC PTA-5024]|uniref:TetR/AcrR family transcriptional regulator n=1 Tax=Microbispora sp. ATCC PTA-5024 TaxID=316330 RepID=UPI0003DCFEF6|nr:TetR/AcrR family transcriptional regulator [Microbispora sp. ATCC PTA-5024]ETK35286.1 TetR family transcriptional regulator [Microbispora sp. ATCC PTA-5024]